VYSIVGQSPYKGGKGRCGKLLEELFLLGGRGGIIWGQQDNRKTIGSRGIGHGKINTQKGRLTYSTLCRKSDLYISRNEIYIFPGSVCLFGCRKIGRTILGIYKLLTDTCMWKLGDRTL
jgi:hypothetical protein